MKSMLIFLNYCPLPFELISLDGLILYLANIYPEMEIDIGVAYNCALQ